MSARSTSATFDLLLKSIPPHQRGARACHPGYQAFTRAQWGIPVYPEGVSIELATRNLEEISRIFTRQPGLNWYARTKAAENLVCLKFESDAARERCEREFGRLYATQVCARLGGTEFWLYQRKKSDPVFRLNKEIFDGAGATVASYTQLQGNVHRKTGEVWEYPRGAAPGESLIAFLPPSWNASLPRKLSSESSILVTPRHEFDPRAAQGWSGYRNLAE